MRITAAHKPTPGTTLLSVAATILGVMTLSSPSCGKPSDAQSKVSVLQKPAGDTAKAPLPASVRALSIESDTERPRLIPERKKHDSVAFASTVAFGRHQMKTWPDLPEALPGSIFPGHRIVAFYGNPLSKRMGVLGEYPVETMLAKLDTAVHAWELADPSTPVQPALQLIAVVAQGPAGKDGM